jgi:ATP-binding cassette subfamily C (CFTR/MRP) protein 1
VIFFASLLVVIKVKTIDPSIVGLAISSSLQIIQTLNWVVRMTSEIEYNIISVERIKEYSVTPTEAAWTTGAYELGRIILTIPTSKRAKVGWDR